MKPLELIGVQQLSQIAPIRPPGPGCVKMRRPAQAIGALRFCLQEISRQGNSALAAKRSAKPGKRLQATAAKGAQIVLQHPFVA